MINYVGIFFTHRIFSFSTVCQNDGQKGNQLQLVLLHLEIKEDVTKCWLFDAPGISTG